MMQKMQDCKIDWIKEIPNNWNINPLFCYFQERKCKNILGNEKNLLSLSYGNIIRKDITTNEGLLPENFNGYNIIEKNDIVLRLTDLQNDQHSLRTGFCKEHGIITSAYVTLKPIKNVNSQYYHYLLHSYDIQKVFYTMGEGIRQSIKYKDLKRLDLIEPPIEIQNKIVFYLDAKCEAIDKAIAHKRSVIEKLKEYRTAVITKAVTKGLNPNVEMKNSGIGWIGKIPKNWEVIKLKYISDRIGDGLHGTPIYSDGDVFFINGNNIGHELLVIKSNTNTLTEEELAKYKQPKLNDNSILISLNGTFGTTSFYNHEKVLLSKSVGFINLKSDKNKKYIRYFLSSFSCKIEEELSLAGTTIANLSLETLRNLHIVYPLKHEQQFIVDYLDDKCSKIDTAIQQQEQAIAKLEEYRKSVIYYAVTGKKEVSA